MMRQVGNTLPPLVMDGLSLFIPQHTAGPKNVSQQLIIFVCETPFLLAGREFEPNAEIRSDKTRTEQKETCCIVNLNPSGCHYNCTYPSAILL